MEFAKVKPYPARYRDPAPESHKAANHPSVFCGTALDGTWGCRSRPQSTERTRPPKPQRAPRARSSIGREAHAGAPNEGLVRQHASPAEGAPPKQAGSGETAFAIIHIKQGKPMRHTTAAYLPITGPQPNSSREFNRAHGGHAGPKQLQSRTAMR